MLTVLASKTDSLEIKYFLILKIYVSHINSVIICEEILGRLCAAVQVVKLFDSAMLWMWALRKP